jgi:succinate dehydrogenase/fumarate reductase flavoprotein subunit
MARRLTLEGVEVKAVCEIMPYPGGLVRNIHQCLKDYDIPLKLSHTVVSIHGKKRVEGVTIAKVDEHLNIIAGTKEFIKCDTLLLSIGLLPENELTNNVGIKMDYVTNGAVVNQNLQTSVDGIFACGNVLHVHDLVDFVTLEGNRAAKSVAAYLKEKEASTQTKRITVVADAGIRYAMPQFIDKSEQNEKVRIYFRVREVYKDAYTYASSEGKKIKIKKSLRLLPAEMEYLEINTSDINGDTIYIGVDKNE